MLWAYGWKVLIGLMLLLVVENDWRLQIRRMKGFFQIACFVVPYCLVVWFAFDCCLLLALCLAGCASCLGGGGGAVVSSEHSTPRPMKICSQQYFRCGKGAWFSPPQHCPIIQPPTKFKILPPPQLVPSSQARSPRLAGGRSLLQLQTIKNNKGIAVKSTYALVTNYFTALKSIYKYIKPLMHY